jgi:hypothetical protein
MKQEILGNQICVKLSIPFGSATLSDSKYYYHIITCNSQSSLKSKLRRNFEEKETG